ncbi:MAG: PAS domain-containing protein [Planctomycetes bacterium]|nr:PAS domain-containing protein [Planctomycetota bacterium]
MADLVAEAEQRAAETAALVAASRAILEHHKFADAARAVFDSCKGLIGAQAGYVALLSRDGHENEVLFLDAGGQPCSVDPLLPMPIRGLRAEAYHAGAAVFENDFAGSPWTGFMPPGHAALENVLFAPLMIRGQAVGLLGLANKPGGFTERDAHLATAFGELAAIALSNSRAQEELLRAKEEWERTFDAVPDLMAILDTQHRIVRVNRAMAARLGIRPEEAVGLECYACVHGTAAPPDFCPHRRLLADGREFTAEVHEDRLGGDFMVSVSPVRNEKGAVVGAVHIARDITERKRAEELEQANIALQDERQRLFSVLEMIPGFIMLVRPDFSVAFANQTFRKIFGDPAGRPCYEVMLKRKRPCLECRMPAVLAAGAAREWQMTDPAGRTFQVWEYPFTEADGAQAVLKLGIDVTERKALEREILEISAEERHRIGQDLHDVLGQNLTGVAFLSKVLSRRLKEAGAAEAEQAAQIADLVARCVSQVRSLSHGLCPVELKEEGLMNALGNLAARVEDLFGIPCRFECGESIPVSDGTVATNLYHIAQEAVNNATKHAQARRLAIRLERSDESIILSVEDDGIGLPAQPQPGKGMGLRIMQYRADLLGASLGLERPEGGGTRVVCTLAEKPGPEKRKGSERP